MRLADGLHGRTYMTMALTGKAAPYKNGFSHFPGSVYHVPYPSDLHGISTQDSLDAIERLFNQTSKRSSLAMLSNRCRARAVSTLRQRAGCRHSPPVRRARYCDDFDEVQSGFARTGKLFAMNNYANKPDLMTIAKSLAGGMPLGRHRDHEYSGRARAGRVGGTYAGNRWRWLPRTRCSIL
ncbi:aminotransferase class III-fold pyridoxal phosphate-dependent enzyme [Shigella flexneri]